MSTNCSHNCAECHSECNERTAPQSLIEPLNKNSTVKKVIGVVSGKGGVGKSLVTSMLAVLAQRKGYQAAILDADITGPSIPKVFGVHGKVFGNEAGIFPAETKCGTKLMSINLLLPNEGDPVVWRGPVIAGAVKQFWSEVNWEQVDYMFVDMPPGTGDVPLTVFQSLPLDGIVVVTSPQELVEMIVEKAVKMAGLMEIPVLGLVENMAYFECPNCHERHYIFGQSHIDALADRYQIKSTAQIPMAPALADLCDHGSIENFEGNWLDSILERITE
ncbi:MAG: P-loop NTPase [Phascolarctobacterium sp.]